MTFYQGSEVWDLRLVDPDNRGPVNFESRMNSLGGPHKVHHHSAEQIRGLLADWPDGRVKLWLIQQALSFRSQHLPLFLDGQYEPLQVSGSRADCVVLFLRRHEQESAIVVVPRWLAHAKCPSGSIPSPEFWGDTLIHLPPETPSNVWRSVLTGESVSASRSGKTISLKLGDILRHFPVGLLTAEASASGNKIDRLKDTARA